MIFRNGSCRFMLYMTLVFGPPGWTQSDDNEPMSPGAAQEIERLAGELRALTRGYLKSNAPAAEPDGSFPEWLLPHDGFPDHIQEMKGELRCLEYELLDDELDLELVASWRNREAGLFDDGEDDVAGGRGYLGVEWSVLEDGFFGRAGQKRGLLRKTQLEAEWARLRSKKALYPYLYNEYLYLFNQDHIERLEQLLAYLGKVMHVAHDLYYFQLVSWEDVIEMSRKRRKYKVLLDAYRRYNEAHEVQPRPYALDGKAEQLPLLELDMTGLAGAFRDSNFFAAILALEKGRIEDQRPWLDEARLRLFLRQEFASDSDGNDALVLGFNARAPIRFTRDKRKKLARARLALEELELQQDQRQLWNEALKEYYEYRYKMADWFTLGSRLGRLEERLRKTRFTVEDRGRNFPIMALFQQALEHHELAFERADTKRRIYLSLLKLYVWTAPVDIRAFLKPAEDPFSLSRYPGSRSVYLWSDGIAENADAFLLGYFQKNEIREVYISTGKSVPRDRLIGLLDLLAEHNIRTWLLVSNNQLLFQQDPVLPEKELLDRAYGVHLDVEPQMLSDWPQRKQEYLDDYVRLLGLASEKLWARDKFLGVSIPAHFPYHILCSIFTYTDEVNVMAYGGLNKGQLARKLADELEGGPERLTLALNCKDFKNRLELEHYLATVAKLFNINRFATQDLKDLILLDKKSLDLDEEPVRP